ncbi:MAG: sodium-dependent transporter [Elusimicrobiota bacterium]
MTEQATARDQWASRIGFIMACAGSAIGLGNIWRFPYLCGMNGGALFVLTYVAVVVFLGIPLMVAEFAMGRSSQRSPVEAYRILSGGGRFWLGVGALGVLASFIMLSYYSVVAGWTMHYIVLSLRGFGAAGSPEAVGGIFEGVLQSSKINLFWHTMFIAVTMFIVLGGVKGGLEKANKIMMPALFIMMFVLLARAFFLPGWVPGLKFMFWPDPSKFTPLTALSAMGQAFFSLSLGMGAMLTYGSYLPKDTDIVKSSCLVSIMDTSIALMAACVIFPILFTFGMEPQAGPGLVFKSMPIVFSQMPGGMLFAVIFFSLLLFAALTSSISMLEVVTAYLMDTWGWSRAKATWIPGLVIFLCGVPSALSGGVLSGWHVLGQRNFFDSMDYLVSNWMLTLGGLFMCIFVGFRMSPETVRREFGENTPFTRLFVPWLYVIRYLCPVMVAAILIYNIK